MATTNRNQIQIEKPVHRQQNLAFEPGWSSNCIAQSWVCKRENECGLVLKSKIFFYYYISRLASFSYLNG
jgi:hypothetical protein